MVWLSTGLSVAGNGNLCNIVTVDSASKEEDAKRNFVLKGVMPAYLINTEGQSLRYYSW